MRREIKVYKVLLLLLVSVWVTPAGATVTLGEIDVRSFLNQPLQAQISAQGSGLAEPGIEIRLASEEVYSRAGMVRSALPSDLEIQLEGTGTNRLIRLTTQRPVREPYLGLLLEARWSAGRIFREYTILLDPPVAFSPERSVAPVVSAPVAPTTRPAPAPVLAPEPARPAPARPATPTFYTVQRGDTLGNIIRRQGYVGVSSEQAMLAILQANPQAFVGQNVNELRAGVELRLPGQGEVAAISDWEARQEIERQTRAWRERDTVRTPPPPAPQPEVAPVPERLPTPTDELPVEALPSPEEATPAPAVEEAVPMVPERPEAVPADRLEILAEAADSPGNAVGTTDMRILQEALLSQQAAMASLRDELRSLRSELSERDQLIRVVNDEFAQLQERFRELQTQMRRQFSDAGFREGMTVTERILSDPLVMALGGIAILLFLLLIITALRPARSGRGQRLPEDFVVDDPALVPLGPAGAESPSPPPPAPRPASRARTSSPDPAPRREAVPARGTGAAAAAALVGTAAGTSATSRATPKSGTDAGRRPAPAPETGPPAESQNVGLDMDDDLLADVDLYLAYGMNDQAISALEHAIKDGHDGNDYRVRLMEAYAANNDAQAARTAAADLRERLSPGDDELRERVAAVEQRFRGGADRAGSQVVPDNDLGPESDVAWDTGSDSNALDFDSFDFPPPDEYREEDTPEIRASNYDPNVLRFDLDETDELPDFGSQEKDAGFSEQSARREASVPVDPPVKDARSSEESTGFGSPGMETDTSENGMRLSLAEAFAEMDDREGALALLDEIAPTATPEQAAKADELRRMIEGAKG